MHQIKFDIHKVFFNFYFNTNNEKIFSIIKNVMNTVKDVIQNSINYLDDQYNTPDLQNCVRYLHVVIY